MKITELTGYKDNPIYKQAKQDVGNAQMDPQDRWAGFDQFTNYLKQHGFARLGQGSFANTYEKPGYPYVFKLFKADPAYLWYFNYCKQHQDNPHVPKIKGNLIKISDDTFCVRMEKLTPCRDHALAKTLRAATSRRDSLNQLTKTYPQMVAILNDITKTQYVTDLSVANIMMRGNTPILTDPLATD